MTNPDLHPLTDVNAPLKWGQKILIEETIGEEVSIRDVRYAIGEGRVFCLSPKESSHQDKDGNPIWKEEKKDKFLSDLDDVMKIQLSEPSNKTDPYMRGLSNGLIMAKAIYENKEANFLPKPAEKECKHSYPTSDGLDESCVFCGEFPAEKEKCLCHTSLNHKLECCGCYCHNPPSVPMPEKIVYEDIMTCDYGNTDRLIDYIVHVAGKVNESITKLQDLEQRLSEVERKR